MVVEAGSAAVEAAAAAAVAIASKGCPLYSQGSGSSEPLPFFWRASHIAAAQCQDTFLTERLSAVKPTSFYSHIP